MGHTVMGTPKLPRLRTFITKPCAMSVYHRTRFIFPIQHHTNIKVSKCTLS